MTTVPSSVLVKLREHFPLATNDILFDPVGGGCINETFRIRLGKFQLFCKINSASKFPQLFEKEAKGLKLLSAHNAIKVPGVIDCFESEGKQVLLLEWISEGNRTDAFWKQFGARLAALHLVTNDFFGLDEDNYMGSVPQLNRPSHAWTEFFTMQRLQPLVEQCLSQKLLRQEHLARFESLYKRLPSIFDGHQKPSLLHGDLWSGNFMCNENSEPVLIDTAVYFGHPSVDLGMTTLFGGFHPGFYEAYHYHLPLPSNYKEQWDVCNLYPLLIHLILFGSSYRARIESVLRYYG